MHLDGRRRAALACSRGPPSVIRASAVRAPAARGWHAPRTRPGPMQISTDADVGAEAGRTWQVLVVGTPGAARGELISALCQRGASVRMTPDLVSARSALRQARFDAIITLPELPDGTGFSLLA